MVVVAVAVRRIFQQNRLRLSAKMFEELQQVLSEETEASAAARTTNAHTHTHTEKYVQLYIHYTVWGPSDEVAVFYTRCRDEPSLIRNLCGVESFSFLLFFFVCCSFCF